MAQAGSIGAATSGEVTRITYDKTESTIVCAVLQVCDVALQAGEHVNSLNLGDTARWTVDPAINGEGAGQVQHLIIQPQDIGLQTSLVVATDRRTYHFRLVSDKSDYMPSVVFVYPEDDIAKQEMIALAERKHRRLNTIPGTGEYLGNLDFGYSIKGNASWSPVRVYNDGDKTVIQMPTTIVQSEAPRLLLLDGDGDLVNYRIVDDRYVVDDIFDRAVLVLGLGDQQSSVSITRNGAAVVNPAASNIGRHEPLSDLPPSPAGIALPPPALSPPMRRGIALSKPPTKSLVNASVSGVKSLPAIKVRATWELKKGLPIGEQLEKWADLAQWNLLWCYPNDYISPSDYRPDDSTFIGSMRNVVETLNGNGAPIHYHVYNGNSTVIIYQKSESDCGAMSP